MTRSKSKKGIKKSVIARSILHRFLIILPVRYIFENDSSVPIKHLNRSLPLRYNEVTLTNLGMILYVAISTELVLGCRCVVFYFREGLAHEVLCYLLEN